MKRTFENLKKAVYLSVALLSPFLSNAQCESWEAFPKGAETAKKYHVIYRDDLKQGNYAKAFENWSIVFEYVKAPKEAPTRHFEDGIAIYAKFMETETDSAKRVAYTSNIVSLYNQMEKCQGSLNDYQLAYKAWYMYNFGYDRKATFESFNKAIGKSGDKTSYFILSPATAIALDLFEAGQLDTAITATLVKGVLSACRFNIAKGDPTYKPYYEQSYEWIKNRLHGPDKALMDCGYFKEKLRPIYDADPNNPEVYNAVYNELKARGCADTDSLMMEFIAKEQKRQAEIAAKEAEEARVRALAQTPDGAVQLLKEKIEQSTSNSEKAEYHYQIAQWLYRSGSFATARQHCLSAASLRPSWGQPYIMIGLMYASSGDACNPNGSTGWDSQVVTWPAIDMWNKAKSIDPSVAAEANKYIGMYTKFMPSSEDIFTRGLKPGASFRVGCWIQETTVIRAAP